MTDDEGCWRRTSCPGVGGQFSVVRKVGWRAGGRRGDAAGVDLDTCHPDNQAEAGSCPRVSASITQLFICQDSVRRSCEPRC